VEEVLPQLLQLKLLLEVPGEQAHMQNFFLQIYLAYLPLPQ
jgi:hypothetical protein